MPEATRRRVDWVVWAPILLAIATAVAGAIGWVVKEYQQREERVAKASGDNDKLIANYLAAVQSDLIRTKSIKEYLDKEYQIGSAGVLESYVYRARANGGHGSDIELASIHELTKANQDLRERIQAYVPCAITPEYKQASSAFLSYVDIYLRRADAIELLAKSDEPIGDFTVFPAQLASAVGAEIAKRKTLSPTAMTGLDCLVRKVRPNEESAGRPN